MGGTCGPPPEGGLPARASATERPLTGAIWAILTFGAPNFCVERPLLELTDLTYERVTHNT